METCYVSIPFGKKLDANYREIDFDIIYEKVIKPAIEENSLSSLRAEDFAFSSISYNSIITNIINSEVMIADLTTLNPNVVYELGLRHAFRKGITIIIGDRNTKMPFDFSYLQVFMYDWNKINSGEQSQILEFKELLSRILREKAKYASVDSPVYSFLPETSIDAIKNAISEVNTNSLDKQKPLIHSEEVFNELNILKEFQRNSDFQGLISYSKSLPSEIQKNPEVIKLLALALVKSKQSKDEDEAISILLELLNSKTKDPEVYGLLGSIYKRRFDRSGEQKDLENSISFYKQGYYIQPSDYYMGFNVLILSTYNNTFPTPELLTILKSTRKIVEDKIKDGPTDYWVYLTALELSFFDRDWTKSETYLYNMLSNANEAWLIDVTYEQLKKWESRFNDEEKKQFESIINVFDNKMSFKEGQAK